MTNHRTRNRNGRRTITVDLKPDSYRDLTTMAERSDIRPSTLAGILLRHAIAETLATAGTVKPTV